MVAFAGSFLLSLVAMGAIVAYGKRRPQGASLTWGEAIAAATGVFGLMFWAYGVVPHQWLDYANNELGWTPSKKLLGPGDIFVEWPIIKTIVLDYEKLRDLIAVGIYGFYVAAHIGMWSIWNNRTKQAEARRQRELEPSTYGRPLVKQA